MADMKHKDFEQFLIGELLSGIEGTRKTMDYDKFQFFDWNRDIDVRHVKELKNAINHLKYVLHNFSIIVIVRNGVFYILDGQHRYVAAKELGLPIYYTVYNMYLTDPYDDKECFDACIVLNDSQYGWQSPTFLKTKAKHGNESAIWMQTLLDRYPWLNQNQLNVLIETNGRAVNKGNIGSGKNNINRALREDPINFHIPENIRSDVEESIMWLAKVLKGITRPKRELLSALLYFKFTKKQSIRIDRLNQVVRQNIKEIRTYCATDRIIKCILDAYNANNRLEHVNAETVYDGKKTVISLVVETKNPTPKITITA